LAARSWAGHARSPRSPGGLAGGRNAGADVCFSGEWRRIDAFPASPTDFTGAGDTFAAGFLARYAETADPWEATRFGSCAASLVIEGAGVEGVPSREAIEARLAANPGVLAR
jgi:sugar/nucleoside kinase (ribokinase family)